jgi:hypothetical protein
MAITGRHFAGLAHVVAGAFPLITAGYRRCPFRAGEQGTTAQYTTAQLFVRDRMAVHPGAAHLAGRPICSAADSE